MGDWRLEANEDRRLRCHLTLWRAYALGLVRRFRQHRPNLRKLDSERNRMVFLKRHFHSLRFHRRRRKLNRRRRRKLYCVRRRRRLYGNHPRPRGKHYYLSFPQGQNRQYRPRLRKLESPNARMGKNLGYFYALVFYRRAELNKRRMRKLYRHDRWRKLSGYNPGPRGKFPRVYFSERQNRQYPSGLRRLVH